MKAPLVCFHLTFLNYFQTFEGFFDWSSPTHRLRGHWGLGDEADESLIFELDLCEVCSQFIIYSIGDLFNVLVAHTKPKIQ